jgi:hypothetical protein
MGVDAAKLGSRTGHHRWFWRRQHARLELGDFDGGNGVAGTAISEDDEFKQAVTYVFSGNITAMKIWALLVPKEMKVEHSNAVKNLTDEQLEGHDRAP